MPLQSAKKSRHWGRSGIGRSLRGKSANHIPAQDWCFRSELRSHHSNHERKRSKSTRTTRVVSLSAKLSEVLSHWLKVKLESEFLFPEVHDCFRDRKEQDQEGVMQPDEASHHLTKVLATSEWEKLRSWQDFRHSFIRNFATQGVDQRFINAWVGHQREEQRLRFATT